MVEAQFTFPIRIDELIHILIQRRLAEGFFLRDRLEILPGVAYLYEIPVSKGHYATPIELRIKVDPNEVLAMIAYIDEKEFYIDQSMDAGIYTYPIRFLKDYYQLFKAERSLKLLFWNTTTDTTGYVHFLFVWAEIMRNIWESIIDTYYDVSERYLFGRVKPLEGGR